MALHYNLSKVYAIADNDAEVVNQILILFVNEIPDDLLEIKSGILTEAHQQVYTYAHKIKPTVDLLGMNVAFEEILQIEAWAKANGKKRNIKETFKSVRIQIKEAIKEIKKDFNL